jgi:alkanesulfonate monooxygenase SsuD/methylene tetrahydromethanopterin reductase-like flavin-dependent oxidoreductase (luciferase family)
VQTPGPPIWVGALTPKGIERAVRVADGFVFGSAAGSAVVSEHAPAIRDRFDAAGKADATIVGLAYVAVGDAPRKALDEATHHLRRYYGELPKEPESLVHHGLAAKIAEELAAYADAVDILIVFPQIPDLGQVEQLAEHALAAVG